MSDDDTEYRYSDEDEFYDDDDDDQEVMDDDEDDDNDNDNDDIHYDYESDAPNDNHPDPSNSTASTAAADSNNHNINRPSSLSSPENKRQKNAIDGDLSFAVKLELENKFSEAEAMLDFHCSATTDTANTNTSTEISSSTAASPDVHVTAPGPLDPFVPTNPMTSFISTSTPTLSLAEMRNQKIHAAIHAFEQIVNREMKELKGKVGPFHTKAMNQIIRLHLEISSSLSTSKTFSSSHHSIHIHTHTAKMKYFDFLTNLASATSIASLSSHENINRGAATHAGSAGSIGHATSSFSSRAPSLKESQEMQDEILNMLDHFCKVIRSNLYHSKSNSASASANDGEDIHINNMNMNMSMSIDSNDLPSQQSASQSTSTSASTSNNNENHFEPHQLLREIFDKTRALFHPTLGARPSEKLWFKINIKYGRMICDTREMDEFTLTNSTNTSSSHNDGDGDGDDRDTSDMDMTTSASTTSNTAPLSTPTPTTYDQMREVITDLVASTSRHTCSNVWEVKEAMEIIRTFNVMSDSLDDLRDGLLYATNANANTGTPNWVHINMSSRTSTSALGSCTHQKYAHTLNTPPPSNARSFIQLHRAQVYAMDMYTSAAIKKPHSALRDKYALVQGEVDRGCILDPKSRKFMEWMKPILYAGHDNLSEDIWIRILQYCCTDNLSYLTYDLEKMAMVSKDFYRLTHMCMKSIALNFENVDIKSLAWACQGQAKVGRLICPYFLPSALLYILDCCSIRDLSALSLTVIFPKYTMPNRQQIWEDVERLQQKERDVGIPDGIFDYSGDSLEDDLNHLHRQVEQKIRDKSHGTPIDLKEFEITIVKEEWHEALLDMFSHSIEDLKLTITSTAENQNTLMFDFDEDLQKISRMIESMRSLKRLKITAKFSAHFEIRSQSLVQICTQGSRQDFRVDECICPSLQLFRCVHRVRHNGLTYNGVAPVLPFNRGELRAAGINLHHLAEAEFDEEDLEDAFMALPPNQAAGNARARDQNPNRMRNIPMVPPNIPPHHHRMLMARLEPHFHRHNDQIYTEFRVCTRRFRGLQVPDTCVVRVFNTSRASERLLEHLNEE